MIIIPEFLMDVIFNKNEYNCSIAAGFYGMIQDKKTYNIKPVIVYAIVVKDEK